MAVTRGNVGAGLAHGDAMTVTAAKHTLTNEGTRLSVILPAALLRLLDAEVGFWRDPLTVANRTNVARAAMAKGLAAMKVARQRRKKVA